MFKNWTDICGGKMTLNEVMTTLAMQMVHRKPKRIIIDIRLREDFENKEMNGYHTKIWVSSKDFKKWR